LNSILVSLGCRTRLADAKLGVISGFADSVAADIRKCR